MKRKIALTIGILGSVLSMTGCQMASIPDMSAEDTQLVAQYAANLILSYNQNYDTGIATEAEIQKDDEKRARQKQREEAKAMETEEAKDGAEGSADTSIDTTVTNAELGTFLGLEGINIDYQSYEICNSYPHDTGEDTFFAMDATEGNQLLVLKFNIQNHSGADQDVDILYQYPLFRISVNGSENKNALTTLLLDDLSTFKDTLTAEEARTVVIVTEISAEEAQEPIQSLSLHVNLNGQNADISLQ